MKKQEYKEGQLLMYTDPEREETMYGIVVSFDESQGIYSSWWPHIDNGKERGTIFEHHYSHISYWVKTYDRWASKRGNRTG